MEIGMWNKTRPESEVEKNLTFFWFGNSEDTLFLPQLCRLFQNCFFKEYPKFSMLHKTGPFVKLIFMHCLMS